MARNLDTELVTVTVTPDQASRIIHLLERPHSRIADPDQDAQDQATAAVVRGTMTTMGYTVPTDPAKVPA